MGGADVRLPGGIATVRDGGKTHRCCDLETAPAGSGRPCPAPKGDTKQRWVNAGAIATVTPEGARADTEEAPVESTSGQHTNEPSSGRLDKAGVSRLFKRAVLAVVLSISLGWLDPFGLQAATERYSNVVLNLLLAPIYPDSSREQVTVVINTDQTLEALDSRWPMPLSDHARFLRTILRHQPKALFVDYVFLDDRQDENPSALRAVMTEAKVPIYYAASPDRDSPSGAQSLPTRWRETTENTTLRPVTVTRRYDAASYDLRPPGPASPALALFQAHCRAQTSCTLAGPDRFNRPMDVIWGSDPPAYPVGDQGLQSDGFIACDENIPAEPLQRLWVMFRDGPGALQRDCPYIQTLPAEALTQRPWSPEVRALLQDRLVLYGGSFHGSADLIDSPTHGPIPGVQMHAMALHNLLLWGERYISPSHAWEAEYISPTDVETASVVLAYGLFVAFLIAWAGPVDRLVNAWRGPQGTRLNAVMALCIRGGVRATVILLAALALAFVIAAALWSQLNWLRLSPINWIGIVGLFIAFLGMFTPYIDRLPALDIVSVETEKRGGKNAG